MRETDHDEEFRERIEKEMMLGMNQDIDDVEEDDEQQHMKAFFTSKGQNQILHIQQNELSGQSFKKAGPGITDPEELSPSTFKGVGSSKFSVRQGFQNQEGRDSLGKQQKAAPGYLKPTVETQLKDLRMKSSGDEGIKTKHQIAEQQKNFPNIYYSKTNLLASPA